MLAFFICNLLIINRLKKLIEKHRVKCCRTFCAKPIEFYFCTRKFSKSLFEALPRKTTSPQQSRKTSFPFAFGSSVLWLTDTTHPRKAVRTLTHTHAYLYMIHGITQVTLLINLYPPLKRQRDVGWSEQKESHEISWPAFQMLLPSLNLTKYEK